MLWSLAPYGQQDLDTSALGITDLCREMEILFKLRLLARLGLGCAGEVSLWLVVMTNGQEEIRVFVRSVFHVFCNNF